MRRLPGLFSIVFLAAGLAACATTAFVPRQRLAEVLAVDAGWTRRLVAAGEFDLVTYASPTRADGALLVVYIEGDGLAFLGPRQVSSDPTPLRPVALELALRDPHAAAYVARPCQYVGAASGSGRNCTPAYWTARRYAPAAVASVSAAIDRLKREAGASSLVLAGYSGGGALAVLIAAARSDVAGIVTVGANLDLAVWVEGQGLTPLAGSLDPADAARRVQHIPQVHFLGVNDSVVPPAVARAYVARMTDTSRTSLIEMPGFDHECCWVAEWRHLVARPEIASIPGR